MVGSFRSLGFRRSLSFSVLFAIITSTFFVPVFAVDVIPGDKLVVEYMFNGGVADTSGNANTVVNSGVTFGVDSSGPISYASFAGASQIAGLTGWSGLSYAVSFWIKAPLSGRINVDAMISYCKKTYLPPSYITNNVSYSQTNDRCTYNGSVMGSSVLAALTSNFSQTIFSTKRLSGPVSDIDLKMNKDYSCGIMNYSIPFDCSALKDDKWHHMVIKKDDYGVTSVYVDGSMLTYSQVMGSGYTFGRSIVLGKSTEVTNSDLTSFSGSLAVFRVYRADLTESNIVALSNEYPLLKSSATVVNPAIPVINIVEPDNQASSFKKMSATTTIGTIQMSLTIGEVCNNTLVFEEYAPMTFNNATDNGTRICYKATNGTNITYKLSDKITGITTESALVSNENVFSPTAYLGWPVSKKRSPTDFMFSVISVIGGGRSGANFVDMNGDGLVDVLYYDTKYSALLVNNGDYTFKVQYKCYVSSPYDAGGSSYYGDCADTNYKF